MGITIDFGRMVPAFSLQALNSYAGKVRALRARLGERRAAGGLPFCDLPAQDTSGLKECAGRLEGRFANRVVLGIGGSALGLIALNSALRTPHRWTEKPPPPCWASTWTACSPGRRPWPPGPPARSCWPTPPTWARSRTTWAGWEAGASR